MGVAVLATACSSAKGDRQNADVMLTTAAAQPSTAVATTAAAVAISATTTTVAATTVPPTTGAPKAWEPVAPGKYSVGVATITVADPAGTRPLTVDVWFPLADTVDKATLTKQRYSLLPGVYYESPGAFAAAADQVSATEKFPLIVYSHGSGGLRYIHSAYTEALASHGYIVVAPDHTGNTAAERITGQGAPPNEVAFARPTDVRRVVDAFVDPAHPTAGVYATKVDAAKVVVTGHSFGGFTSIASVVGFTNELGTVAADPRVVAIVPMAPAAASTFFPDAAIASIRVPMMVLVGTDDKTTPVDPNVTRLWDLAKNSPAYRVELKAGEHQTFTDLCAYKAFLPTLSNVPPVITQTIDTMSVEGCSPGDIAPARANELITSYVVRFLNQVLRNGPSVTAAGAAPADVIFASR
jgi:predicted dienelactone hydrolase